MNNHVNRLANHSLLSSSEELELAKSVSRRRELLASEKTLTNSELSEVSAGEKARTKMILHNAKLVIKLSYKYIGRGVDFDDLFQCGNIGLLSAIDKFDWQKGFKLSTYATWWIKQALGRAVADSSRTIRLPVHMFDLASKIIAIRDRLIQELARMPTLEEVSIDVKLPPERVEEIMEFNAISLPSSLDEKFQDDEGDPMLLSTIPIDDSDVSESAEYRDISEAVVKALDTLTSRERRVVELRFGLNGCEGVSHTLAECGKKFGLTRERIRQLESGALKKLRHPRRSRELRGFVDK